MSVRTPYQMSQNMQDYDPAIDAPLEHVIDDFGYDATSCHVPTGMAMLKFATLLEALDWHWCNTKTIDEVFVREKIKWASDLMDKKFDIPYERLPQ
jgi:hypothetical protein